MLKDTTFLRRKSFQIRLDLLNMIYNAKAGHIGSSLSCADIMTVLYYSVLNIDPKNPSRKERDRFILSKGHAVEVYYCILADLGFFTQKELETFSRFGTRLLGHPNNKVPGVEMNTGALGHGLSISVGMALAGKMDKKNYRVFTLMGDGELAEGSVWEGAMAASSYKLDNLIAIVDRNRLQISGNTENIMKLEPLEERWEKFGWEVVAVDGHDFCQLRDVLNSAPVTEGKPTLVMAYTTKGKGISFMENIPSWHHGVPSNEEYDKAVSELKLAMEGCCDE